MTPELRAEARRIYLELLDLPMDQRAAHLEQACIGRPDLRAEVESLVRSDEEAGSFLADPSAKSVVDADATPVDVRARQASDVVAEREPVGTRIGPYVLGRHLGVGGFGDVYLAEQREPLVRTVALKIIKLGMDTQQVIARFEAERQVLAMMEHPNIARVIDAGATDKGRPYFVMEWIDGEPITAYCDRHNLSIRDRLSLFSQICAAVQHAHSKGIIHRDIKPGNILVAEQDGKPVVKVIDFGIAKATQAAPIDLLQLTGAEQFIGTPAYMSPEQARDSQDIDTQSDIYSLGVVLYELLTGTTPFDSRRLKSAAYHEMLRIISEVEPPRPSNRLTESQDTIVAIATRRGVEPRRLSTTIRGELDWIVMKALEKERKRRYATANAMAADIKNYLTGLPVVAAPPGRIYRGKKFVRRHSAVIATGSLILASIVFAVLSELRSQVRGIRLMSIEKEQAITKEQTASMQTFMAATLGMGDVKQISDQLGLEKLYESSDELIKVSPSDDVRLSVAIRNGIEVMMSSQMDISEERRAYILRTCSLFLARLGHGDEAYGAANRALNISRGLTNNRNSALIASLNVLAMIEQDLGQLVPAEAHLDESLKIAKQVHDGDSPAIAQNLSDLALLRQSKGEFNEARLKFADSLAMYKRLFPGDHADVATVLKNLATTEFCLSNFEKAENLYTESLAMRQRIFGDEHPNSVISVLNLSAAKKALGQTDASLALAKAAFEACVRHPEWRDDLRAAARDSYSTQLREHGKKDEANKALLRIASADSDHTIAALAPENLRFAAILAQRGSLLMSIGEFSAATESLRKCLAFREIHIADGDPGAWRKYNAMSLLGAALVESVVMPGPSARPAATATSQPATQDSATSQPTSAATQFAEPGAPVALDLQHKIEMLKEAEGLLLRAWDRMKDDPNVPTPAQNQGADRRKETLERIVRLYTVWEEVEPDKGHGREAATWHETLSQWSPSPTTTSAPR